MFEHLPQNFTETIKGAFRQQGKIWLQNLPHIIGEIESNWKVIVKEPFPNLSYHFVAPCVCDDGGEAVLKIGFPGEAENIFNEMRMLKFLKGESAVKLLRFDEKRFAILLEKLTPGANLKMLFRENEEKAVETAICVMRKVWRAAPKETVFPKIEGWFENFKKY